MVLRLAPAGRLLGLHALNQPFRRWNRGLARGEGRGCRVRCVSGVLRGASDSSSRRRSGCPPHSSRSAFIFSSAIAVETSGIFTAKVPPNPQHSSSFSQSTRSRPSTFASSPRGSSRTPSSRRWWHPQWKTAFPSRCAPRSCNAHHVDQEVRELPNAPSEGLGTLALFRQVLEDEGVVVGDHGGARSRGTDYVVEAFLLEDVEEVTPHGAGLVEEAGVEGRLTATGLAFRIDHVDAKPPQYAHHAYAYLGVDQVHVARYEQGHPQTSTTFPPSNFPNGV